MDSGIETPESIVAPLSRRLLITLGTPHGGWVPMARAALSGGGDNPWLQDDLSRWLDRCLGQDATLWPRASAMDDGLAVPAEVDRWGGVDERACWALDALLSALPDARCLVFVESPQAALRTWLRRGAAGGAGAALALWLDGARRLQRLQASHAARAVFVDAERMAREPATLERLLRDEFAIDCRDWQVPAAPADACAASVAEALAASSAEAIALHEALRRHCVPAAGPPGAAAGGIDASDALVARLAAIAESSDDALAQAELRVAALQQAVAALRASTALGKLDYHREADARQALASELETLRARLRSVQEDRRVLEQQVLETQRELARHAIDLRRLERTSDPASVGVRAMRMAFSTPSDDGVHRHVDIVAQGLRSPAHGTHDQRLRLVEHRGHPGIALIGSPGQPTALTAWQPTLREGDHDVMLLIPADAPSRIFLEQLGTADWITLLGLVHLIECELAQARFPAAAAWRTVAARLFLQLRSLPKRLRYDRVALEPDAAPGTTPTLRFRIETPMFGDDLLATATLLWRPESRWTAGDDDAPLRWLLPDLPGAAPALTGWPLGGDDSLASSVAVPVGAGLDAADKRRRWSACVARDRDLLLAVLDALVGCAAAAGTSLPPPWQATRLTRAAQELRDDAAKAVRGLRLRQLARRGFARLAPGTGRSPSS